MSEFSIPVDFLDNCIFKAKPEYSMVYLYVYRYLSNNLKVPDNKKIAEDLRIFEEDVLAAFNYWSGKGYPINGPVAPAFDKSGYKPAEISRDGEFSFVCDSVEKSLGKILSTSDRQTLFWIYDYLGFSSTIIIMMVNYAMAENKGKMRYIEKLAISWAEKGLYTVEAAEKHLSDVAMYRSYERRIKNKLGVTGREFTPSEKQIIRQWETEVKPTEKQLVEALEICVARTGKVSLKYINGILTKWKEEPESKKAQKGKFANFKNRTDIDYDKIEIEAMKKRINRS